MRAPRTIGRAHCARQAANRLILLGISAEAWVWNPGKGETAPRTVAESKAPAHNYLRPAPSSR